MTYRVVFTVRARADVIEQCRYLADRSPPAGTRVFVIESAAPKSNRRVGRFVVFLIEVFAFFFHSRLALVP